MSKLTVALIGNPNCGKSTLFNALTGAKQRVGNWPGVTVECKTGEFITGEHRVTLVDLPGIYELLPPDGTQAIDERIACDFLLHQQVDCLINIVDAAHLERHLYLTLQLLTLNIPLLVVVNMMDVAERRQVSLDLKQLSMKLNCPVVGVVANKSIGVTDLKKHLFENLERRTPGVVFPTQLQAAVNELGSTIQSKFPQFHFCASWIAQQLLQGSRALPVMTDHTIDTLTGAFITRLENEFSESLDLVFADSFYTSAHTIAEAVISQKKSMQKTGTERIDTIVLNRFLGIPIFLGMMYAMFLFAINLGGAFQDFFDISSDTIFVQGMTQLLNNMHSPHWLIALLAAGLGRGINTTISFIPVISAMFFFLAFLESSGYMARASFVIDRLMNALGLPGKSFVPMIVGFGCNVPAILAARTLENPRDRTLTVLMSPFMSCGARLAIFAVFTAAFFPIGGQNVVFALYVIGIIAAVLTGFLLRKTVLSGGLTPLVMELPAYHLPSMSVLMRLTWHRLKSFIFRAGKLIIPVCMLIGLLNTLDMQGKLVSTDKTNTSMLSTIGRAVTPILSPMGIQQENWPASVGLVTGVLAKEVVVATLNTLYSQEAHLSVDRTSQMSIDQGLKLALMSIATHFSELAGSFANPVMAHAPEHTLNHHIYGIMYARFGGQCAAFAYLLFVLLYFPCVSATAVMAKELTLKWALFSVGWSTAMAYGVATCFYQVATLNRHPTHSVIWLAAILLSFSAIFSLMKRTGQKRPFVMASC